MTLNNSMSITPSPPGHAKGVRFEHGSVLGGKTRAARVSSQWKSTVACGGRTRYVLRTLDSEVHPSCIHGLKHFFGRSGAALRDAELLERFRPPCTGDGKGFHVELQDFTRLLRDLIRADDRTKLDDAMPWPGWPGQKGCDLRADVVRRDHGRFPVCRIIVDR